MKKNIIGVTAAFICLLVSACGSKKETAASIAQTWCNLNAKAYKAGGAAREAAEAAREKFEKEMEEKYKNNKAFMDEVEKEIEKCEDASEGQ